MSPMVGFSLIVLLQLLVSGFADNFVNFSSFNFTQSPNDSDLSSSSSNQFFAFTIPKNTTAGGGKRMVNISLSTDSDSGVVVSALRCSPTAADTTDWLLLLFADHSDYKSVKIDPENIPIGQSSDHHCPQNPAGNDQILLLKVHEMVNGSRGTVALRSTVTAEEKYSKSKGGGDDPLIREKEESAEWLIDRENLLPQILAVVEDSRRQPRLSRYSMDMAIRRGSAQLSLISECLPLQPKNASSSHQRTQTIHLGNFSRGEHREVFAIKFGAEKNDTEMTIIQSNGTTSVYQEDLNFVNCADQQEDIHSGKLSLIISSLSSAADDHPPNEALLVALSQHRTFASPSSSTNARSSPLLIILLFLLLLAIIAASGAAFILFGRRFAAHSRRIHYQNEREGALRRPSGFFELDIMRGRERIQRKQPPQPAENIDVQALVQNTMGSSNNSTRF